MNSKLIVANILRLIARVISIALIPIAACYLLFVGLQIPSEGGSFVGFFLYMLFLLAMLAGLVIAWWREGLGSIVALTAIAGFFVCGWVRNRWDPTGFREILEESSPLAGPLHLLFALLKPGYHADSSPIAKLVPMISWVLLITPICLSFASWLLRRKHQSKEREMPPEPLAGLPDKEKEVLHLISEGLRNLEIADRLGISGVQASLTTSELLKRFGVDNKDELVNQARQQGHLPPN